MQIHPSRTSTRRWKELVVPERKKPKFQIALNALVLEELSLQKIEVFIEAEAVVRVTGPQIQDAVERCDSSFLEDIIN